MGKPINKAWRGKFRGGNHGQHSGSGAITVSAPSSAEDALTILTQHTEVTAAPSDKFILRIPALTPRHNLGL